MREPAPDRLPLALKIGWGFGSVGTITVLNVNALLLLFFMTTVLGLAPALAGGMLFAAKLIDAVMAPALGSASDRTRSRWGRRRPYLLAGAIVSALGVAAVFQAPPGGDAMTVGWVAIALAIIAVGYTLFNVPYLAMPAELTASPTERTSLVSWRIAFVSLGGLFTALAPKLSEQWGYPRIGLALGMVVFAAMLTAFLASARAPAAQPVAGRAEPGGFKRFAVVFDNAPFMRIIAAKVCQLVGLASLTASVLFLFTAALGQDKRVVFYYVLASTVASIASMPLWVRLGRGHEKRVLYGAGCVGFALVTLSWLLAGPGEPMPLILARGVLAGLCSGGLLLMGQSLLPDTIDYDCRRSGVRREGVYAGFYSLVEKTSMAFGPLLVGVILQAFGFDPKAGLGAVQSDSAMTGVYLGASVIPAALYALSVLPLLGGTLSARRLAGEEPPGIGVGVTAARA